MAVGVLHPRSALRSSSTLVARGGLAHTFGGLASFLAVTFLSLGTYVVTNAIANPLQAHAAAVLAGAFAISLSGILLFYLIKPSKRPRKARSQGSWGRVPTAKLVVIGRTSGHKHDCKDLSYQRLYADHSLILTRSRS